MQNPGWSAQRHRRGRQCKASRNCSTQARPRSPYDGRRYPARQAGTARHANRDCREKSELSPENRDRRSRAPPPPPAEGATSLLLRRLRGRLLKRTSPHGLWPRAWGNPVRTTIVVLTISLLRRGARVELSRRDGTALRPRRPPTKAKKTPAKAPVGPPGGRCRAALGTGLPGEKNRLCPHAITSSPCATRSPDPGKPVARTRPLPTPRPCPSESPYPPPEYKSGP